MKLIYLKYLKLKMSKNKPVQLGLCCLNMTLRDSKPTVFSSRKMIIKSVETKGIDALIKELKYLKKGITKLLIHKIISVIIT